MNYGNMNMNFMNSNNPPMQQNNPGAPTESFRNVFGVLGISINLLIGGLQSLLHIFTSLIDILYFAKAFKSLIIDLLIMLLKKIFRILKYLITFRWFFKFIHVLDSKYVEIIFKSKNFKVYSIFIKLFLILGITICLILKYLKTTQLSQIKEDDKIEKKENIRADIHDEDSEDENFANNFKESFNLKKSQERWKEEL